MNENSHHRPDVTLEAARVSAEKMATKTMPIDSDGKVVVDEEQEQEEPSDAVERSISLGQVETCGGIPANPESHEVVAIVGEEDTARKSHRERRLVMDTSSGELEDESSSDDDTTTQPGVVRVGGRPSGSRSGSSGSLQVGSLGRQESAQGIVLVPEAELAPDVSTIVKDAVQEALQKREEEERLRDSERDVEDRRRDLDTAVVVQVAQEEAEMGKSGIQTFICFAVVFVFVVVAATGIPVAVFQLRKSDPDDASMAPSAAPTQVPTLAPIPPILGMEQESDLPTFFVESYVCSKDDLNATLEYDIGVDYGDSVGVCFRPNERARYEGLLMESVDNFYFKDDNQLQEAVINGSTAPNMMTTYDNKTCSRSTHCYLETILFEEFFWGDGLVAGHGRATMHAADVESTITVSSSVMVVFLVNPFDGGTSEPTAASAPGLPFVGIFLNIVAAQAAMHLFWFHLLYL